MIIGSRLGRAVLRLGREGVVAESTPELRRRRRRRGQCAVNGGGVGRRSQHFTWVAEYASSYPSAVSPRHCSDSPQLAPSETISVFSEGTERQHV